MIYALHQFYPTRNQVFILVYHQPHYGFDIRSVIIDLGFQIDFQYEDRISAFVSVDSETNATAFKNLLVDAINTRIERLESQPCLSFFVQRSGDYVTIFSRRWTANGWTNWTIWRQFNSIATAAEFLEGFRTYEQCHFWYYEKSESNSESKMDLVLCRTTYSLLKEKIR